MWKTQVSAISLTYFTVYLQYTWEAINSCNYTMFAVSPRKSNVTKKHR